MELQGKNKRKAKKTSHNLSWVASIFILTHTNNSLFIHNNVWCARFLFFSSVHSTNDYYILQAVVIDRTTWSTMIASWFVIRTSQCVNTLHDHYLKYLKSSVVDVQLCNIFCWLSTSQTLQTALPWLASTAEGNYKEYKDLLPWQSFHAKPKLSWWTPKCMYPVDKIFNVWYIR